MQLFPVKRITPNVVHRAIPRIEPTAASGSECTTRFQAYRRSLLCATGCVSKCRDAKRNWAGVENLSLQYRVWSSGAHVISCSILAEYRGFRRSARA